LRKGKLVFIEGRIQTREWDDRDGNKRRKTEIVASNMQMLESRGSAPGSVPEAPGPSQSNQTVEQKPMDDDITDDDIPF